MRRNPNCWKKNPPSINPIDGEEMSQTNSQDGYENIVCLFLICENAVANSKIFTPQSLGSLGMYKYFLLFCF